MDGLLRIILLSSASLALSGCVVIAVVDTAASLAVGAVGLVGDAAIGTVKVAGKVVGATADAVLPGGK
ncbi:MAG: hypothetical protein Q7U05_02105 [Polaromonas sp.]|jgi:hypothetical protein|nr:hypothetical protein [Polaromonas sp.]